MFCIQNQVLNVSYYIKELKCVWQIKLSIIYINKEETIIFAVPNRKTFFYIWTENELLRKYFTPMSMKVKHNTLCINIHWIYKEKLHARLYKYPVAYLIKLKNGDNYIMNSKLDTVTKLHGIN